MQMKKSSGNALKWIVAIILLPFRPLMVIMPIIFGNHSSPEFQEVIVLRVEALTGILSEARIESEIQGAGVRLGDKVALWGSYRAGILIVIRGYNYTTGADIRLRR